MAAAERRNAKAVRAWPGLRERLRFWPNTAVEAIGECPFRSPAYRIGCPRMARPSIVSRSDENCYQRSLGRLSGGCALITRFERFWR